MVGEEEFRRRREEVGMPTREPDFEYTEVRGTTTGPYEPTPTMGTVGRTGREAAYGAERDPERIQEMRRAAIAGVDRTELGAAGIAVAMGLLVLAGLMHVLTALGVTAGFAGLTQMATNIPGFEQLVALIGGYSVFALILGVVDFVAAWGLWNLKSWSWGLAVVLAILGFFVLPFGPIGSILLLVFLLQDEVHTPYKAIARAKEHGGLRRRYVGGH